VELGDLPEKAGGCGTIAFDLADEVAEEGSPNHESRVLFLQQ
jgi:hypothetical protein